MKTGTWKTVGGVAALIAMLFILPGCATTKHETGRQIDDAKVAMIKKGETTSADILEWFGAPTTTSAIAQHEIYVYKYCITKTSTAFIPYVTTNEGSEQCDELAVTFDKNTGKVVTYSFQRGIQRKS